MKCLHNWVVLKEERMPSPVEINKLNDMQLTGANIPSWYFRKKYICILKCTKCGKLDKTIEENP